MQKTLNDMYLILYYTAHGVIRVHNNVHTKERQPREGLFVMFFALSFRRSVSFHQSRLSPTNNTNNAHRSPFSLYYCLLSSSPPFYILAWLGVVLKECRSYEKRQSNIRPREKNEILQGHFCQFEHD